LAALHAHGVSRIHRLSYAPIRKLLAPKGDRADEF